MLRNSLPSGLFVGLATLDIFYQVDEFLERNKKAFANHSLVTSGGPATNAAITFKYLGGKATLLTALGTSETARIIKNDIRQLGVEVIDVLNSDQSEPVVASIISSSSNGDRTVLTTRLNGLGKVEQSFFENVGDYDFVLLDGYFPELYLPASERAKINKIPVILDGGSWKPNLEKVLWNCDYALVSANFHPPSTSNSDDVFEFIRSHEIIFSAITHGGNKIQMEERGLKNFVIPPKIKAIDTLGAGDIFHGAFAYYFALGNNFSESIKLASSVAAFSCRTFGTREWMETPWNNQKETILSNNFGE